MSLINKVLSLSVATVLLVFSSISAGESIIKENKSAQQFELQIENRQIKGGLKKIKVTQGDWVSLSWFTDERVDLHLHGYDIELTVMEGESAVMNFHARATGRFPITSHGFGEHEKEHGAGHHAALLYLEVYPE